MKESVLFENTKPFDDSDFQRGSTLRRVEIFEKRKVAGYKFDCDVKLVFEYKTTLTNYDKSWNVTKSTFLWENSYYLPEKSLKNILKEKRKYDKISLEDVEAEIKILNKDNRAPVTEKKEDIRFFGD